MPALKPLGEAKREFEQDSKVFLGSFGGSDDEDRDHSSLQHGAANRSLISQFKASKARGDLSFDYEQPARSAFRLLSRATFMRALGNLESLERDLPPSRSLSAPRDPTGPSGALSRD